jgi:hypothetical protein
MHPGVSESTQSCERLSHGVYTAMHGGIASSGVVPSIPLEQPIFIFNISFWHRYAHLVSFQEQKRVLRTVSCHVARRLRGGSTPPTRTGHLQLMLGSS